MAPRVTVIVTSYNYARFLRQRLESILAQTYRDFELLFLDDASRDNSLEVFSEVMAAHPGVAVRSIVNRRNTGNPFVQWNRGVAAARGELIWIAESDDFAEPDFLGRMVSLLDANRNAGIAYCQSAHVDEEGRDLGSIIWSVDWLGRQRWERPFVNRGVDEVRDVLLLQCTIPNASGVVFRRRVFEESGGAETGMRLMGDWLTWGRMLTRCDIAFEPQVLNYFRVHPQSLRHEYDTSAHLDYVSELYQVGLGLVRLSAAPRAAKHRMLDHYARIVRARLVQKHGWRFRLQLAGLATRRDPLFPLRYRKARG